MAKKYVYEVEDRQLDNQGFYQRNNSSNMYSSSIVALVAANKRIECNTRNGEIGELINDSVNEPEMFFVYDENVTLKMMDYYWMSGDKKVSQRIIVTKHEIKTWS